MASSCSWASAAASLSTPAGAMPLAPGGAFYADAVPVSNTAYKAFCDATGYPYPEAPPDTPDYFYAQPGAPVLNITQREAVAFAQWSGKRLPTSQEWEKAAAARQSTATLWEWTSSPASAPDSFVLMSGGPVAPIRTELPAAARPGRTPVTFRCVKDPPGR